MRTCFLAIALLALSLASNAAEVPTDWKRFLDTPLIEEWQPIFGMGLTKPARPAETWAQKFVEFQRVISKSTGGQHVPIFISPELAATQLPAVPEKNLIGLPVVRVPIGEAIKFIANLANLQMRVTDAGVLLDLPPESQAK